MSEVDAEITDEYCEWRALGREPDGARDARFAAMLDEILVSGLR